MDITNIVRDLLKLRDTSIETIAKECGVSVSWLNKFIREDLKEPSADKIKNLFRYLTSGPHDK